MSEVKLNNSNKLVLDGHMWVIKDGKIVDETTDAFVSAAKQLNKKIVYSPYCKEKSAEIVQYFKNSLMKKNEAKCITWDEWLNQMENELKNNKLDTDCINSSLVYQARHGGEIVVGCFGVYTKNFDSVSWLFGHPNDPEWLKNKSGKTKTYNESTRVTPDLIWDERTP